MTAEGEGLLSKLLRIRRKAKRKKPDFERQEGYRYKRLKECWRRPRGRHSKLRKSEKARGRKPGTGYMSPAAVRGLTGQGLEAVLVSNRDDVLKMDPKKQAAVIRSAVGKKKRMEIISEAEKRQIRLLNAYKFKLTHSNRA
jgi:large subunit ribosomal protein L32e